MNDLFVVDDGIESRKCGLLEQPLHTLKYAWPVLGASHDTPPLIPRSQWKSHSLKTLNRAIADQNGVGMCASAASVNGLEIAREMAGLEYVPLSGGDLYRRVGVNGGDNGSLPEDNLRELIENGVAPVSDVPYLEWRRKFPSQSRSMFKVTEAWLCPTVDHVVSAILHGFPVVGGYWHHNNDPVSNGGWMSSPSGRSGGHAVLWQGVVVESNRIGIEFENSWTSRWGFGGYATLPESRVAKGLQSFQAWALRATAQENGKMPPLRG